MLKHLSQINREGLVGVILNNLNQIARGINVRIDFLVCVQNLSGETFSRTKHPGNFRGTSGEFRGASGELPGTSAELLGNFPNPAFEQFEPNRSGNNFSDLFCTCLNKSVGERLFGLVLHKLKQIARGNTVWTIFEQFEPNQSEINCSDKC